MSKKTLYILLGAAVVLVISLVALSKAGIIGNKNQGKEVEIATVLETTIIETVSATGKIQPNRNKNFIRSIWRSYRIANCRRTNG